MTATLRDIGKLAGLLVLTPALVYGLLTFVDRQFRADPRADHYITVEEKLLATSLYGDDAMQDLIRKDEVTFDPAVGRTMGKTIQHLKQTDLPKVLLIGPSTLAYVEGDSSPQFYIHRVDKAMKRLSEKPIEVYNLATEGMRAQEMINVLEKATQRVSFDYVLVGLGIHVLYHNSVRPTLQDLPNPDPDLVVADLRFEGDLPWYAPPELNARAEDAIQGFLGRYVPFFRNRVAIQKWAGHRLTGMATESLSGETTAVSEASAASSTALQINNGAGVTNGDFSQWDGNAPAGWSVQPGTEAYVSHATQEECGLPHALKIDGGQYKYAVFSQSVPMSGPLGGHALRLRAKVKTAQPGGLTRVGFVINGENVAVRHPNDGAWHTLEVTYTFPYDVTDRQVEIKLAHTDAKRAPTHPAYFTDVEIGEVPPQPVKEYYLTEPMIETVNENVAQLLAYLAEYQAQHGSTVAVMPGPVYQSEEHPVYFPGYLEEEYMTHLRGRCDERGIALIDTRAAVPNDHFHMSGKLPSRDGVHFDAEGHTALAKALLAWLAEQGL